ncbi:unnamed protein product, partial [Mesorhabditis belari]|uniref:Uncharacterized protein n=1 Tax=Mesorhabditis belari TaxID=2138241 RepID=A0AAF3FGR5_9BILA
MLSSVLVAVLIPGFFLLSVANRLYPDHITKFSSFEDLLYIPEYLAKAAITFFLGWLSLMVYGDLVLPAVNSSFQLIFSLTHTEETIANAPSEINNQHEHKEATFELPADSNSNDQPEPIVSKKSSFMNRDERNDSGIGLDEY